MCRSHYDVIVSVLHCTTVTFINHCDFHCCCGIVSAVTGYDYVTVSMLMLISSRWYVPGMLPGMLVFVFKRR